jgi:acyl-CoA synthetase (AMP-forming)/AMP-acid ligase II
MPSSPTACRSLDTVPFRSRRCVHWSDIRLPLRRSSTSGREAIPYLAKFKTPRSVVFVEELPHNATSKLLKRVLREQAVVAP